MKCHKNTFLGLFFRYRLLSYQEKSAGPLLLVKRRYGSRGDCSSGSQRPRVLKLQRPRANCLNTNKSQAKVDPVAILGPAIVTPQNLQKNETYYKFKRKSSSLFYIKNPSKSIEIYCKIFKDI